MGNYLYIFIVDCSLFYPSFRLVLVVITGELCLFLLLVSITGVVHARHIQCLFEVTVRSVAVDLVQ